MNPEKNSIFQGWVSCANFSIHFQATVFQPCIRAFHITSIQMIANSHLDCRGFLIHIFYVNAVHAGTSYLVRLSEATAKSVVGGSQRLDELGGDFDISLILHLVRHKRKRQYLHQNDLSNYRYIAPDTQFDFLDPSKEGEIDIAIRIVCVKLPDGSCEYLDNIHKM